MTVTIRFIVQYAGEGPVAIRSFPDNNCLRLSNRASIGKEVWAGEEVFVLASNMTFEICEYKSGDYKSDNIKRKFPKDMKVCFSLLLSWVQMLVRLHYNGTAVGGWNRMDNHGRSWLLLERHGGKTPPR